MNELRVSLDAHLRDTVPKYWCAGDAFETRFLEAMSLIAPEVERFVIGAVRCSMSRFNDKELVRQCMSFIQEEAEHSRIHHAFNRRLTLQGIDVHSALSCVRQAMNLARKWLPSGGQLSCAAACEHLSALLSLSYMRAERRSKILSMHTSQLFENHAREELGHRAFLFDLLHASGGGNWLERLLALTSVSLISICCALAVVHGLLKHDVPQSRTAMWLRGGLHLLRPGYWVSPAALLSNWLSYFRPGFHPSQLPER